MKVTSLWFTTIMYTVLAIRNETLVHKYDTKRVNLANLNAATLLTKKQKSIASISGLSNEILCILVAQGAAKLWRVKVGGQKNMTIWLRSIK